MPQKYLHIFSVVLILLTAFTSSDLSAQNDEVKSDAKREEIQRYVGYETLIYRYLSLPYDVTMNNNERGTGFLDIGFLLLMFLPILVMIRFRHRWSVLIIVSSLMLIMFIVSTSNSFLFNQGVRGGMEANENGIRQPVGNEVAGLKFTIDGNTSLNDRVIRTFFNVNNTLYKPFKAIGDRISGQKDSITYPLVLFIFAGIFCFWMFIGSYSSKIPDIVLVSTFLLFAFYWFILSPGIVWYGFLGLLLGFITLVLLLPKKENQKLTDSVGHYAFYSMTGLWLLIGLGSRISNVQPGYPAEALGKTTMNPVAMKYIAGEFDESTVINMYYINTSKVFDMINSDKRALIYRIGTSFSYFIDNNHERVIMDNQLQLFNNLTKVYTDKREIAKALKASNIKYFMIDLHTPTLDNTPEQSLTKKYNKAINFLFNNPNVQLLATDRVITKEGEGEQRYNGMFGAKVVEPGSFAIYKLR